MGLFDIHKNDIKQKLIAEHTREIIIFFNREGKITDVNAMAITEFGCGNEIYQYPIYDIFKNEFRYQNNKLNIIHNLDRPVETIAYRKNQTCFTVELKISIHKKKMNYIGLCTAKNITVKKDAARQIAQLKSEVEALHQDRSEIAANITHELRTPTNGIMGLSNNLLDTELMPNQLEMVQLIKRCCNNMNATINNFLDYAKIANEKMVLEQREFGLRNSINIIIDLNKPRINDKGLQLSTYISDDIPDKVIGDEYRLTQILNNLISNAVKFTLEGQIGLEVVMLSQSRQDVEMFFMVIDTGTGIDIDEKDKLFQSFSQVDGSITRRFGGTGLGLAISKKLVEAMRGTIGVDSEKGKGSTFSFSVHLGLPVPSKETENDNELVSDNGNSSYVDSDNVERNISELMNAVNIEKLLKKAGGIMREGITPQKSKEDLLKNLTSKLEKLTISIEMESWDKAEELAYHIKKLLPTELGDLTKTIFRLLLAVRKESYELSIAIINELKVYVNER